MEIFGGEEKKNVKRKGGKCFKREYTILRRRRRTGEENIWRRTILFCRGKKHGKGKYFFGREKEKGGNIWKWKIYVLRRKRKTEMKKEENIMGKNYCGWVDGREWKAL